MADKNITTVNEISSIDDSDKVFVNDGNTLKQITVINLMKKAPASSGGGTTDYNDLTNQPQLNGVTLKGNKTLDQVGALAKNQGSGNSGKFLSVGSDGNVVPADAPSGGTVDPEQIKQAVNGYLEENPVSGMTTEQEQQLNQNTSDVADLKSALPDKLDTNQGAENKGKSMVVGEDGELVPENIKIGIDVEYIPEDEMLVLSGGSKNTDESPESPDPITNDIELLDTIILTPSQKQININLDEYNKKEYFVLVDVPKTENKTYFRIGIGNMYSLQSPHDTNINSLQVYAIIHNIDVNYYGFATMNDGWAGGTATAGIIPTPRTEEKYLALSFYPYVSGDEEAAIKIYGR